MSVSSLIVNSPNTWANLYVNKLGTNEITLYNNTGNANDFMKRSNNNNLIWTDSIAPNIYSYNYDPESTTNNTSYFLIPFSMYITPVLPTANYILKVTAEIGIDTAGKQADVYFINETTSTVIKTGSIHSYNTTVPSLDLKKTVTGFIKQPLTGEQVIVGYFKTETGSNVNISKINYMLYNYSTVI